MGDAEGIARQERLLAFARRTGVRVLGPNCVGFLNPVASVAMAAAVVLEFPNPPRGRIGLVSQSGGVDLALPVWHGRAAMPRPPESQGQSR